MDYENPPSAPPFPGHNVLCAVSNDFWVDPASIVGNTFKITPTNTKVVPGFAQRLSIAIELSNGEVLTSWAIGSKKIGGVVRETITSNKTITVKPMQTMARAALSRNAVTLYRLTPHTGESVTFGLTTPANVKLGAVQLDQAALTKLGLTDGTNPSDGFRLVQNGQNSYTVCFIDGKAPIPRGKASSAALKPGYTLRVELWAEGTYVLIDPSTGLETTAKTIGAPEALVMKNKAGKVVARSKPTTVNVKVNIR